MGIFEFIIVIVFVSTVGNIIATAVKAQGRPPGPGVGVSLGGADRAHLEALTREVHTLRAEVEQLRHRGGGSGAATTGTLPRDAAARLADLTEEIHALRDTSTQFDMTFDAALDRLERRIEKVEEQRVGEGTADSGSRTAAAYAAATDREPPRQVVGGQR